MKVGGLRRLIYIKSVAIIYLKKNLPSKLVYFSPFKNKPSTFESPLFLLLRSNNLNTINKPKKRLLLRTARTILFDRRQARLTFPMQHQKSPDRKSNLPSLTRLLSPPVSKQKKRKKGRRRGGKKKRRKKIHQQCKTYTHLDERRSVPAKLSDQSAPGQREPRPTAHQRRKQQD